MEKNGNIKLSFGYFKPQFFTNKENGTVVCKLKGELRIPMLQLAFDEADTPYRYRFNKSITAIGKTTCSKDDVFDENRGKRIALARAENEVYNIAKNYLMDFQRYLEETNEAVIDFYEKAARATKHNKEYILGLSDKNNPNYKEEILPPVVKGHETIPF